MGDQHNLFGRLDYQAHFGSMTTDFTMIRPGAIHLANGGYLLLQVQDLLQDPRSWIKLRRTLKSKQARVEDLGDTVMPFPVVNLQPDAGSQSPNTLRITHLTEASSTAEDRGFDIPLTLEFVALATRA